MNVDCVAKWSLRLIYLLPNYEESYNIPRKSRFPVVIQALNRLTWARIECNLACYRPSASHTQINPHLGEMLRRTGVPHFGVVGGFQLVASAKSKTKQVPHFLTLIPRGVTEKKKNKEWGRAWVRFRLLLLAATLNINIYIYISERSLIDFRSKCETEGKTLINLQLFMRFANGNKKCNKF